MTGSAGARCGSLLLAAVVLLGGCLPSSQSQLEEEKEPHYQAGKSRVNSMDYRGAIECFEKALEANPQSAAAHLELGWLYDQKEPDAPAAIYHYEKYLKLRQNPRDAENVRTRILACKQDIARTVSLGPVTRTMERELEQLFEENKKLKAELERLKAAAVISAPASNAPGPTVIIARRPSPAAEPVSARAGSSALSEPVARPAPVAAPMRTHTVRQGETATMIARKYGVRLEALTAANPRLDPRRMRIGQSINIPGS